MVSKDNKVMHLKQLLKKKIDYLANVFELTNLQTSIIENEEIDKLDRIIKNKQKIINEINRIDTEIDRYSSIISEGNNNEINKLIYEIKKNIMDINEIDNNNKNIMDEKFAKVKSKLHEIKNGRKVTSGYFYKPTQTNGYFIDKKK